MPHLLVLPLTAFSSPTATDRRYVDIGGVGWKVTRETLLLAMLSTQRVEAAAALDSTASAAGASTTTTKVACSRTSNVNMRGWLTGVHNMVA